MSWKDANMSVIVRGHMTTDDPEADGYLELELGTIEFTEWDEFEGDVQEYAGGTRQAPVARRRHGMHDTIGFEKTEQGTGERYMDWGDYQVLRRIVFDCAFRWYYRTRLLASSPGLGPIPRAREDGNEAGSLWNAAGDTPPGILPLPFNVTGGLRAERDEASGGHYNLKYEWESVTIS